MGSAEISELCAKCSKNFALRRMPNRQEPGRALISATMSAVLTPPLPIQRPPRTTAPPLENGDQLAATEFMRRYHAMPQVKKAELIQGEVHMASPVSIDQHAEPDALAQLWLGFYAASTPGVKHAINGTVKLSADDVPQPDGLLRLVPEVGGSARVDADGYLRGAPEFVVEVAASSASIDARKKLDMYRRAGVREYVVWRTLDEAVDWWVLEEDEYRPLPAGADGVLRSRVLPGLWLDPQALIAGESARVLVVAQQGVASEEHRAFVAKLTQP